MIKNDPVFDNIVSSTVKRFLRRIEFLLFLKNSGKKN